MPTPASANYAGDTSEYARSVQPNVLADLQGVQQIKNSQWALQKAQNQQADETQAGSLYASGDTDAATNYLYKTGHIDKAIQMGQVIRQATADHLNDIADTHQKIANLALLSDTPDKWQQALQAAQKQGINTQGFEDFNTGRNLAVALGSKAQDLVTQEKQRRTDELAQFKGATSYNTTMPPDYANEGNDAEPRQATIMRLPTGEWTKPVATPDGVDINAPLGAQKGAGQSTQIERVADAYQADWKKQNPNGPDLPRTEALNAASIANRNNSGTGIRFEPDEQGIPRLKTSGQEGTSGYGKTEQGAYNLTTNREAGKFDVGLMARNSLGSVVKEHADMLDKISRRPDFSDALAFLHTPDGARFLAGEALPLGTVPQTANDLQMTIGSLQHEYGNFVAAGHKGAMSEHEGSDLNNIVGQLRNGPDAQTFQHNIETLKDLAGAFQRVSKLGVQGNVQGGGINSSQQTPPSQAAQGSQSPKSIQSKAEYDALPSGSEFLAPDGSHRRKP